MNDTLSFPPLGKSRSLCVNRFFLSLKMTEQKKASHTFSHLPSRHIPYSSLRILRLARSMAVESREVR